MGRNGKDLVTVVVRTEKNIRTLEDLKKELKSVETPKLVSGYLIVKDFANRVRKFTEAVREELLYGGDENARKKEFNGRFFTDDVETDEKGHRYLIGEDEKCLKAEKRVSLKLNEEKATKLLKEKGLYDSATDKQVVGVNVQVLDRLNELKARLDGFARQVEEILDEFEIVETLNEKKIEALVALEALSGDEVEEMYDVDVTYALKEQKKKK